MSSERFSRLANESDSRMVDVSRCGWSMIMQLLPSFFTTFPSTYNFVIAPSTASSDGETDSFVRRPIKCHDSIRLG